jgi:catecholate siderophore receptor
VYLTVRSTEDDFLSVIRVNFRVNLLTKTKMREVMRNYKVVFSAALSLLLARNLQAKEILKTTLPSVVVTAEKEGKGDGYKSKSSSSSMRSNTPLLDTPQSVSVVTQDQIRDQNIEKMEEAARYVPGVNVQMGEGHRDQVTIRGMTNGNNGTTSNFFIDGARDDAEYVRDFYNIENIEFLKGPNAMAFGRGSPGGAINRVSKMADGETKRRLVLSGGSFDNRRVEGDVGGAVNDKFAIRLNSMYQKSGSYRDYAEFERYGFNPTATIQASDDTKIQLGYEHFDDSRTLDRGIPAQNGLPYRTNSSNVFGDPTYNTAKIKINSYYGILTHDFDDSLQFKNTTRYTKNDKFYSSVDPKTITGNNLKLEAYQVNEERNNFTNQTDLIKKFETGSIKHNAVIGAEVTKQDNSRVRAKGLFVDSGTNSINVPLSSPISYQPITFDAITDSPKTKVDVMAAYLQDQIDINKYVQLTGGIRVDRFEVNINDRKNNKTHSRGDTMYSPRFGLVVKPQKSLSLYSSYGVTYQPSSGDQMNSVSLGSTASASLRPEKITSYEVGTKWDVTPRINLSTALFQIERTNTPSNDPNNVGYVILAGESRTRGFEFAATGKITDNWQTIASYAFQDAEIIKATRSYSTAGKKVALVPHNTFALWNKYDFTKSFAAGLGVVSQSDQFADANNSVRLKGFTRFDAAAYYKINSSYRAQFNVENIFDSGYYLTAHSATNILPGSPRAFKVSLIADF